MLFVQSYYDSPLITVSMFSFLSVVIYFMPVIVAAARRHHQKWKIVLLNLLAGWTIIGWIAALVWALMPVETPYEVKRKRHLEKIQK